jgi:hypothetical protein
MLKIAGTGSASRSGSISQRHKSADPDPDQNVMNPQHWPEVYSTLMKTECRVGQGEKSNGDIEMKERESSPPGDQI